MDYPIGLNTLAVLFSGTLGFAFSAGLRKLAVYNANRPRISPATAKIFSEKVPGDGNLLPPRYLVKTRSGLIKRHGDAWERDDIADQLHWLPETMDFKIPNRPQALPKLIVWEPNETEAIARFRSLPSDQVLTPRKTIEEKLAPVLRSRPEATASDLNDLIGQYYGVMFRDPWPAEAEKQAKTWVEKLRDQLGDKVTGATELATELAKRRKEAEALPEGTREYVLDLIDTLEADLKVKIASR